MIRLFPSAPWMAEWPLSPPWRPQQAVRPEMRLGPTPGRLRFATVAGGWELVWPCTGTVQVTPHGVVEEGDPARPAPAFCLVCPHPGLLVGEADATHAPALRRIDAPDEDDPSDTPPLPLETRTHSGRIHFHLRLAPDADPRTPDPMDSLREALAPYQPFAQRQATVQPEDQARISAAVAALAAGLTTGRPGQLLWTQPDGRSPGFSVRDLYALARAWCEIRPEIARALFDTALAAQGTDGSIPAHFSEHGAPSDTPLSTPLLTRVFRHIWRMRPERDWFDFAVPRLREHLAALAGTLDPDQTGQVLWPAPDAAIAPELFEPALVAADLPALLIREISDLETLSQEVAVRSVDVSALLRWRTALLERMRADLWSAETGAFTERFTDGRPIIRHTITSVMPLVCAELSREETASLIGVLLNRQQLLGNQGVMAWAPWADDVEAPPVWPLHQLLLLEALDDRKATAEAAAIRSALQTNLPSRPAPADLALLVHLLAVPTENRINTRIISPLLLWMDRHRPAVLGSLAALFLALNGGILLHSCRKTTLTPQVLETSAGMARRYYEEKEYAAAEALMREIIESGQPTPSAYLDMGNILFRMDRLPEAESYYRRQSGPDVLQARARHNLAVTLHAQGRRDEARQEWRQIAAAYAVTAPDIAARAAAALELLGEDAEPAPPPP